MKAVLNAALIVAVLLGFAVVSDAYTDFLEMSKPHTRVTLPSGHIQVSHDVHHQFDRHGTFFKAKYVAVHEAKWHFVELHTLVDDFAANFQCSPKGESELVILNPSAALIAELQKQDMQHTIVTAHPRHHCDKKGIFRKLVGLETAPGKLILKTLPTTYTHVFKDMDLKVETNHVHMLKSSGALAAIGTHRGFAEENWFTSACSSAYNDVSSTVSSAASAVASTVSSAASDVEGAVSTVSNVVSGNYNYDNTWDLPGASWHTDLTDSQNWDIVDANAQFLASFDFQPTVTFQLQISDWSLENVEAYFTGSLTAGAKGQFSASVQQTYSGQQTITTINLSPISFAIGPVPVVLTPSIPINGGYTVNIDGQLTLTASVSASANVRYGFAYSPSTGHRTIQSDGYSYNYDFSPKSFSVEIGIKPFVQPVLQVQIDYIGTIGVGAAIYANVLVQSNGDCMFDLSINAQPVLSVTAGINIGLDGHNIYSNNWGPYSLYSATYPLYSYCLPNTVSLPLTSGSGHGGTSSGGAAPAPTQGASSAGAAPVPSQGASSAGAAPAPTQGASSAGAAPVPSQGASSAGAAPVPSQGASSAGAAPAPTQGASSAGAAPAPAGSMSGSGAGRHFSVQSSASIHPFVLNSRAVQRTVLDHVDSGHIGKTWQGRSVSCGAVDMTYSLSYGVDVTGEHLMRILIHKSAAAPNAKATYTGMHSALGQAMYTAPASQHLRVGATLSFSMMNNSNAVYVAASNASVMTIAFPPSFQVTFSPSDIRYLSMDNSLTCGPVALTSPESNNDNTTFNMLKRAAENPTVSQGAASDNSGSSASSSTAVVIYAAVVTGIAVLAVGVAVFYQRKSSAGVRPAGARPLPTQDGESVKSLSALMNAETEGETELRETA